MPKARTSLATSDTKATDVTQTPSKGAPKPVDIDCGPGMGAGSGAFATLASCSQVIPPDVGVLQQRFVRFVRLSSQSAAPGKTHRAIVPTAQAAVSSRVQTVVSRNPTATWADVYGGVAILDESVAAWDDRVVDTEVTIGDVETVIATREVEHEGRTWKLELSPSDVAHFGSRSIAVWATPVGDESAAKSSTGSSGDKRAAELHKGSAAAKALAAAKQAAATNTDGRKLLHLRPAVSRPAADIVQVADRFDFLARPKIPTAAGAADATDVKLNADLVRQIRDGSAQVVVPVGGSSVTIHFTDGLLSGAASAGAPPPDRAVSISGGFGGVSASADFVTSPSSRGMAVAGGDITHEPDAALELVLGLQWSQKWTALGYTRGQLLNSVALAPQEQTTIEIFTWDRNNRTSEQSSSVETDDSLTMSDTTKDTTDVFTETSKNSNFNWNVNGSLSIPIVSAVTLGVSGGAGGSKAMNALTRSTTNNVHEAVVDSATKIRSSRQSKVSETRDWGSEQRVTRTVSNPNMCRVLHLDYFEILSRYQVCTSFDRDRAQLCVLVPCPVTPTFTKAAIRENETALRRALLDPALVDGFEAARLLEAREHVCAAACRKCTCGVPNAAVDLPEELRALLVEIAQVWTSLALADMPPVPKSWMDESEALLYCLSHSQRWGYRLALQLMAPSLFECLWDMGGMAHETAPRPATWADAHSLWWAVEASNGLENVTAVKLLDLCKDQLDQLGQQAIGFKVNNGQWDKSNAIQLGGLAKALELGLWDQGLVTLLRRFLRAYQSATTPAPGSADLGAASTNVLQDAFPATDVAHATERLHALQGHLSANASHYWLALWTALTATQQASMLSTQLPADLLVEPWPMGIVGNRLALPLVTASDTAQGFLTKLFPDDLVIPAREDYVSLPTPAITCEARLGACNACEDFILETRTNDLALHAAQVRQAEAEADAHEHEAARRKARLDQEDLTSFTHPPATPTVKVDLEHATAPAPTAPPQ